MTWYQGRGGYPIYPSLGQMAEGEEEVSSYPFSGQMGELQLQGRGGYPIYTSSRQMAGGQGGHMPGSQGLPPQGGFPNDPIQGPLMNGPQAAARPRRLPHYPIQGPLMDGSQGPEQEGLYPNLLLGQEAGQPEMTYNLQPYSPWTTSWSCSPSLFQSDQILVPASPTVMYVGHVDHPVQEEITGLTLEEDQPVQPSSSTKETLGEPMRNHQEFELIEEQDADHGHIVNPLFMVPWVISTGIPWEEEEPPEEDEPFEANLSAHLNTQEKSSSSHCLENIEEIKSKASTWGKSGGKTVLRGRRPRSSGLTFPPPPATGITCEEEEPPEEEEPFEANLICVHWNTQSEIKNCLETSKASTWGKCGGKKVLRGRRPRSSGLTFPAASPSPFPPPEGSHLSQESPEEDNGSGVHHAPEPLGPQRQRPSTVTSSYMEQGPQPSTSLPVPTPEVNED